MEIDSEFTLVSLLFCSPPPPPQLIMFVFSFSLISSCLNSFLPPLHFSITNHPLFACGCSIIGMLVLAGPRFKITMDPLPSTLAHSTAETRGQPENVSLELAPTVPEPPNPACGGQLRSLTPCLAEWVACHGGPGDPGQHPTLHRCMVVRLTAAPLHRRAVLPGSLQTSWQLETHPGPLLWC